MKRSVSLAVPATLSNLGPGFDVLGLAIDRENRFAFYAEGLPGDLRVASPNDHLIVHTLRRALDRFGGVPRSGIRITQQQVIPRSRGQGSSSTARVAGLAAWAWLTGAPLTLDDALGFLADEEGHADNAAGALLGGLVAVAPADGGLAWLRLPLPAGLRIALCVPEVEISTDAARAVLPRQISLTDAVHNLGRLAFLLGGLAGADASALAVGVGDRLHQPHRAPLIGPAGAALEAARAAGAAGAFISGSGSTLAALVLDPQISVEAIGAAMAGPFEMAAVPVPCAVHSVRPRARGVWIDGGFALIDEAPC